MGTVVLPEESVIEADKISHPKWRKVLAGIESDLQQLNAKFSVCGPFGFELLWQAVDAPKRIRKFYVYTNNPERKNKDELANVVEGYARKNIQVDYPEILDDFVIIAKNEKFELHKPKEYVCKFSDKLLDIQVRNTAQDILTDYANYLILFYQSILTKTGEAQSYEFSAKWRNRMFQLFLALEAIYLEFLPNSADRPNFNSRIKLRPYINNKIQFFFENAHDEYIEMDEMEQEIIEQIILPFCEKIDKLLRSPCEGEKVTIFSYSYHIASTSILECTMSKALYETLVKKIISSYYSFN